MRIATNRTIERATPIRATAAAAAAEATRGDAGLRQRIALLTPPDRAIAQLVLDGNATHRAIATLLKRSPGTVSRTVRALLQRLRDPRVIALLHEKCPLEPEYRQLGVESFLQGRPVRELAVKHALSPAEVRRRLECIDFWYRGLCAARRWKE